MFARIEWGMKRPSNVRLPVSAKRAECLSQKEGRDVERDDPRKKKASGVPLAQRDKIVHMDQGGKSMA